MIKNLYFYKLFITKFQNACSNHITYLMAMLVFVLTLNSFNTVKAEDNPEDIGCLVEALYFEARSETFGGMIAVGNVILNRVRQSRYPNTICSVVHAGQYWEGNPVKFRCAFSYWCDGKPERYNDINALADVQRVVMMLTQGVMIEGFDLATHYHAHYVEPYWAYSENFVYLGRIGRHLFYETLHDY